MLSVESCLMHYVFHEIIVKSYEKPVLRFVWMIINLVTKLAFDLVTLLRLPRKLPRKLPKKPLQVRE